MKTFQTVKLVFCICAHFIAFTTNAHASDPLSKIKSSDDFQNFLEQGILCENEWGIANVFSGYGRKNAETRISKLKKLGEMAKNHHFTAKFSLKNKCNFELVIYPSTNKNKLLSMDFDRVLIGRTYGGSYFLAFLNTEKDTLERKLMESGYKKDIGAVSLYGGEIFLPRNAIVNRVNILFKECGSETQAKKPESGNIATICQKPSMVLGCHSYDKLGSAYQTCPW
jgi:hypothetical protein